jgi:hypothetical protein
MARKFSDIFRRRPVMGAPDDTAHGESQAQRDEHTRFAQAQAKKLWETVTRHRHREARGR